MTKLLIAIVAFVGVAAFASHVLADDKAESQKITGVLIDAACGKKNNTEEKAAAHDAACVAKCAAKGALTIISGEKVYKLDDASKAKALEYLKDEKGEGATRVAVEGTVKDNTLTITSIKKAEKA